MQAGFKVSLPFENTLLLTAGNSASGFQSHFTDLQHLFENPLFIIFVSLDVFLKYSFWV